MNSTARKLLETEQPKSENAWNRRILVVDDEPDIRSIYRDLLRPEAPKAEIRSSRSAEVMKFPDEKNRFSFDVVEAGSATEALEIVQKAKADGQPFAMGFFDVRLGEGMDGVSLVKEIQQLDPNIYAVFVTAYNDRTIDSIAATLGPNTADRWDYMVKPFSGSEIIQKARNFVSLWNLNRESEAHAHQMSEINRRIQESERVTSVAAVARGVAHEFGNLLMQIMGKAEISRNKSETEMRAALEKIVDASQRAHEILDRFNHLSDTKSKSTLKTKQRVDVLIQEVMELMSHQFKSDGVRVHLKKLDAVEAKVHGTSLLQVLVNLMINSMHAMQDKKLIEIELVDQSESHFVIQVRDTGTGISEGLINKVLEPFFTTKGNEGTGLGLAISREIIEIDHGGHFKLSNHPQGGLIVKMEIPKGE